MAPAIPRGSPGPCVFPPCSGRWRPSDRQTLPDGFVYRHAIDQLRRSLAVGVDGPPALVVEVLGESTYDVDLDLERGKGDNYARAGGCEYPRLDPTGAFVPE